MTMPAVPPYSSATIARCMPSRRMSASAARIGRVQGSTRVCRASSPTRSERLAISGVEQVADVHEADHVVGGARGSPGSASAAGAAPPWRPCRPAWRRPGSPPRCAGSSPRGSAGRRPRRRPRRSGAPPRPGSRGRSTRSRSSSSDICSRLAFGSPPTQPDDDVGGDRQQPDDRPGDLGDPVDGRAERQREALRALQRQPLGRQLAEHQGDVGDRDRDQHQRDDVARTRRRRPGRPASAHRSPARSRHRTRRTGSRRA